MALIPCRYLWSGIALGLALVPLALAQPGARAGEFARVIENVTLSETLRLEGPEWNDTLVRRVIIRGVNGDGIFLKNVVNVRIEDAIIEDVSEFGIRLSSAGSTRDVQIVGNRIARTGRDGITAAQRLERGIDHPGLVVAGNMIDSTGLAGRRGRYHGIYVQSTDFLIAGNRVTNSEDGNGISVRSSGVVRGNVVIGAGKSGIAYYADHMCGPSDRLVIEANGVGDVGRRESRSGIDLLQVPEAGNVVRDFVIRDNTLAGIAPPGIAVHPDYAMLGIVPRIHGNRWVERVSELNELSGMGPQGASSNRDALEE